MTKILWQEFSWNLTSRLEIPVCGAYQKRCAHQLCNKRFKDKKGCVWKWLFVKYCHYFAFYDFVLSSFSKIHENFSNFLQKITNISWHCYSFKVHFLLLKYILFSNMVLIFFFQQKMNLRAIVNTMDYFMEVATIYYLYNF